MDSAVLDTVHPTADELAAMPEDPVAAPPTEEPTEEQVRVVVLPESLIVKLFEGFALLLNGNVEICDRLDTLQNSLSRGGRTKTAVARKAKKVAARKSRSKRR